MEGRTSPRRVAPLINKTYRGNDTVYVRVSRVVNAHEHLALDSVSDRATLINALVQELTK